MSQQQTLKQQIEAYQPFDEREAADKQHFLEFINTFPDVLTRNNHFGHFATSAIIVNQDRTKMLMVHHNIYKTWIQPGGHADGIEDLMSVAKREAEEETGIKDLAPLSAGIFDIKSDPIHWHIKKNHYVPTHLHFDINFLFEADDSRPLKMRESENTGVAWIPINKVIKMNSMENMDIVYERIIAKIKQQELL